MPDPDAEYLRKEANDAEYPSMTPAGRKHVVRLRRIADRLESMAKDIALLEEACEKYEAKEYARQEGGDGEQYMDCDHYDGFPPSNYPVKGRRER